MSALQVLKTVHKWGTEPEIVSHENVTFGLEKFGFRVHRKLESVSNLHFSEVWVQSQKLIKSKVEKAYFNQNNLLWSIDLNLMAQINSWHWPGLVCQLRTVYRIILSWRKQRVSPSVTSTMEWKSIYQVGWAAEKEHFSFPFQTSLVCVPVIADTLII